MRAEWTGLGLDTRKELYQRGFFEYAHAQNLEDFEETGLAFDLLADDGHQGVNADGDPELGAHRVLRASVEGFNAQVLLNPFEEQFHLPTLPVELSHHQRGQGEVVDDFKSITPPNSHSNPDFTAWFTIPPFQRPDASGLMADRKLHARELVGRIVLAHSEGHLVLLAEE